MRTSIFLSVLSTAVLGLAIDAPVVTNNISASYYALLPNRVDTQVRGLITISSAPDDQGAEVAMTLSGLPSEGGPFLYHIHVNPISADGNCTSAGAHLDPYGRGESPPCDSSEEQTCQVGDLSGKHGNITETGLSVAYSDKFLSLVPGTPAFIGNRSIVVHFANLTRITCANFVAISTGNETKITPPGFASSTVKPSSTALSSANSTSITPFASAGPTTTKSKESSTKTGAATVTGTGAANPAYFLSSGAILGAVAALVL